MNVALLSTFDTLGGAAIATYRLHQGLQSIGVCSNLVVQSKKSDDCTVLGPRSKLEKIAARFRPHLDGLANKIYWRRDKALFSAALLPDRLASRVIEIKHDVIHLFWVSGGFLKIETLREFNRPIIWTLHDMWPFTGGCHYDNECRRFQQSCGTCPILHSENEHDLSRYIWERKRKSWENIPITVVATSHWLADMARSSSVFRNRRIEVIPNGINTDKYKPIQKKIARATWSLPQDKHLILFSAFSATSDKRKGNQFLMPALERMAKAGWNENTELVIIGASGPENSSEFGMKVHYMGHLHDEESQVLLYSAADVTVAPSMQENLSNTVMESLACGTPVVAFNIGGMPDLISHQKSGYLVAPFDINELASGIAWILEDKARHDSLSQFARQTVMERYASKVVANQYLTLYQDVVKSSLISEKL